MERDKLTFQGLLRKVCDSIPHESILLSGGLDSSILMLLTQPREAITIILDQKANDFKYATLIAKKSKSRHHVFYPNLKLVIDSIKELIAISQTFDPIFIRNNVIQLMGLKQAIALGCNSIILGDGADELFAGYNYLHKYINNPIIIQKKIMDLVENMHFFSEKFAKIYNLKIYSPFLSQEIISYSKTLSVEDNISTYKGKRYGKFFLRTCFESILGMEVAWRNKEALEIGSGMTFFVSNLGLILNEEAYSSGVKKALEEGVTIRNKEHLIYYKIYRQFFEPPMKDKVISHSFAIKKCPSCKLVWKWCGNYCKMCGFYPA